MTPSRAAWVLAGLGLWIACSGDDFEGGGGGGAAGSAGQDASVGGSASGAAGASGSGAASGMAGSSGKAGASGASGSAGAAGGQACKDGGCAADEYCHSDGGCRKCTDFDEFEFGEPEPLTAINAAHTTETLLTPRAASTPLELFYVVGAWPARKIWFTPDATTSAGDALPDPVDAVADAGDLGESAPSLAEAATQGLLKGLVLFFDRNNDTGALSGRKVMGAGYDVSNKVFLTPAYLPAPFNGNNSSWEITVATQAQRAWFMSNRDNVWVPKLYTASTGSTGTAVATTVSLTTLPYNCPIEHGLAETELSPWAAYDGSFLIFQTRETASGCKYGTKTDVFIVALQANGQSAGFSAFPLSVNLQNINESGASLSYDTCWLYFASDRNLADRQQLYRARRK